MSSFQSAHLQATGFSPGSPPLRAWPGPPALTEAFFSGMLTHHQPLRQLGQTHCCPLTWIFWRLQDLSSSSADPVLGLSCAQGLEFSQKIQKGPKLGKVEGGGAVVEEWIVFGPRSYFPMCYPHSPLNLNDFLPLNNPGVCFSERLSHSFPAGSHTLGQKVWLVPGSPSHGCHPCLGNWGWDPHLGEGWPTLLMSLSCVASCLLPVLSHWLFLTPGHTCMLVAEHPGTWELCTPLLSFPAHLVLSPAPLGTNLAFR